MYSTIAKLLRNVIKKVAIDKAAAFHLAAIYADAFATVLHGLYDPAIYQGMTSNVQPQRQQQPSTVLLLPPTADPITGAVDERPGHS